MRNPDNWYYRHHKVDTSEGKVRPVGGYDYVCSGCNQIYMDAIDSMKILEAKNKDQNLKDLAGTRTGRLSCT